MIIECVICQETGLFKSSVTCNICNCKICRPCFFKMKSLKKQYLRLCPLCRGEHTLMYNNGKMAFDKEDFETFYRHQRIHIILTLPKVIMSWLLFFFWLYCVSSIFFSHGDHGYVVNLPLFTLCLLALVHFYCC